MDSVELHASDEPNAGGSPAREAANQDLAIVLRRYGFWGLDPDKGGAPVTPRFAVVRIGREAISLAPSRLLVVIAEQSAIGGLPGVGLHAEPAGGLLFDQLLTDADRRPCYRALLPHVSFSGAAVTPVWIAESGRAVIGWWTHGGRRHLLVGLNIADEIVRYTQGDPGKVAMVEDKTMWGSADHERPAYLFGDNIVPGYEMMPWADRLGYAVARFLAEATGMPLIAPLPDGAKGAVLLTGDDDEASLENYDEQLQLLVDFPITYFMLPHTRHSPETIRRMPKNVEFGVHIDSLPDPAAYEAICDEQTNAVRRLTGRQARSVRNHGHLNRGYWGFLSAWERCGLLFDLNIRGIDGTCPTGSFLPYRIRREDGTWSSHTALFSTFSDSMYRLQHWPAARQVATITALADQIEADAPGVIVVNLHPTNVGDFHETLRAIMEIGCRPGWVALGAESYADWLNAVEGVRLVETAQGFELHSPVAIDRLAYSWPGGSGVRVLPRWQGAISLRPELLNMRPQKRSRSQSVRLRPTPEEPLSDVLRRLPPELRHTILPSEMQEGDCWHSWDPTPWAHPWLTSANLQAAKAFDHEVLDHITARYGGERARERLYGFVGNLANNMAMRALPLRRRGYSIDLFLHPSDRYVMSQPGWEISDIALYDGETNIDRLRGRDIDLPYVADCFTPAGIGAEEIAEICATATETPMASWANAQATSFLRQSDILVWPWYMVFRQFYHALQPYDCLLAAQIPYAAYLANKPYLAAQTGGDLWLEASRGDALGSLQRRAYGWASAILATNPWAYSNARRYGFRHVLYVPLLIDTEAYAPGPGLAREAWQREVGGDFFVLVTARIDRLWKGSHIGIEGFAQFARQFPNARLVLVGWGENSATDIEDLRRNGLDGRFIQLPISGKRKLVEYLRAADCLLDQFAIGYYGATALEAMAVGTPVIMHLLREQYDALCPTGAPPILNARSAEEVAAQLERLISSAEERRSFSMASRRWIKQNHSVDVWGETYGALLNAVADGKRLPFARSPLAAPLTGAEREYHRAGLAAAPPFPEYLI